jgi:Fe-S cluster biogenesis protein NfuA
MENGVVKVELKGACSGCPMSAMTVQWGIERYLKSKIPEVLRVEAVQ